MEQFDNDHNMQAGQHTSEDRGIKCSSLSVPFTLCCYLRKFSCA